MCGQKSQDSVHKPQFLKRMESRSGSNRGPSAYQPSALPLGHTGSQLSKVRLRTRRSLLVLRFRLATIIGSGCHNATLGSFQLQHTFAAKYNAKFVAAKLTGGSIVAVAMLSLFCILASLPAVFAVLKKKSLKSVRLHLHRMCARERVLCADTLCSYK